MLYPPELQARAGIIAAYGWGSNASGGNCARDCAREPSGHVLQVGGTRYVVAVKDTSRPMAGDLHGNAFRNARVHHIADRSTSEVMP